MIILKYTGGVIKKIVTDLSNGIIGAANLDSDEEIQQDYSEEENAKEDATIRDKDCRDVKKIFDIYIQ